MSDDSGDGIWGILLNSWWGQILFGVVLFGIAGFLYWYLSNLEATGAAGRVPCCIAIVYNFAGKWGTVLMTAGLGAIVIGIGVRNFIALRRDD